MWHVCLRNCVWILAVHENREVPIEARGVPRRDDKTKSWYTSIVVRSEKTFSGVERTNNHPVETILQQIATPNVAKAPCPGFKGWTNDGKGLTCCRPSYHRSASPPPNIVFGPFNFKPGGVYSPAPHLVATSDCSTRGYTSGSTTLAIMIGEFKDLHKGRLDFVLSPNRFV